jgi:hypothetical protein
MVHSAFSQPTILPKDTIRHVQYTGSLGSTAVSSKTSAGSERPRLFFFLCCVASLGSQTTRCCGGEGS